VADVKKAVVLLSGGIDSATTLAVALNDGFECYALSCDYGQRHVCELEAAREIAEKLGAAEHLVIQLDLQRIGGSALTDDIQVPKRRSDGDIGSGIPATYVPARNTIFLSIALAWAEVIGAFDVFIGAHTLDYPGYPDCRPEFLEAFEKMAKQATKSGVEGEGVKIRAPLIEFSKTEIIELGCDLGVDFSLTHSCYDPTGDGLACGECDSCIMRKKGFTGAGIEDPAGYKT
jgi:7-cyano-7-deazaguanine synthase